MSCNRFLFAMLCGMVTLACSSANATLIITGLFDGPLPGGDPKGVELYAIADVPDLTQYAIGAANNGGGTDGPESGAFPAGSLSAGDFYYLSNGDGTDFTQWFGFAPNYPSVPNGAVNHNGDDAIELFFDASSSFTGGEAVVDIFGDINEDGTGTAWDSVDGWAYRKNATGPDGSTFVVDNWFFSGPDAWDGDDLEDDSGTNAMSTPPFPTGTYIIPEPTSICLMLAGVAGFALRRR